MMIDMFISHLFLVPVFCNNCVEKQSGAELKLICVQISTHKQISKWDYGNQTVMQN